MHGTCIKDSQWSRRPRGLDTIPTGDIPYKTFNPQIAIKLYAKTVIKEVLEDKIKENTMVQLSQQWDQSPEVLQVIVASWWHQPNSDQQ